jgi:short-subunit dehydrogenase
MMTAMHVQDVGCLVTGASSGIGRAVAVELGRRGCRVALIARREHELEATRGAVEAAGGSARAFPADVTDPAGLAMSVGEADAWAGGLRLMVANAGVGVHGATTAVSDNDVRAAAAVNLVGTMSTIRAALPYLAAAKPSVLVALASLMGLIPVRGGGTYGATKAGTIFYLRCLRLELAGSGVGVGWVCPGAVDTAMFADLIAAGKLPRLARRLVPVLPPERVARGVVAVAERGGGQKVLPAPAAFFAAFARHFPRLTERVLLLSGAGEA